MGLLDDVIGAALGARAGGGLSAPIATALIALFASRLTGAPAQAGPASAPGAAVSPGGLGGLLERFRNGGLEDVIASWIGTGPNAAISPAQLHRVLGQDTVDALAQQSGLAHGDLLAELSRLLPGVVDGLTPNGRLPSDAELLPAPR
jgi:uncharacterized protein YidB (DUF937 family)